MSSLRIISRQEARSAGLHFYFTGKACKRGHIDQRGVKTASCLACVYVKGKNWRENNRERNNKNSYAWAKANPEKAHAAQQKYYYKNQARRCEIAREWAKNNPEQKRATKRAWIAKNLERKRATARLWAKKNRDRRQPSRREWNRQWRKNNPDKRRIEEHIRRTRKRAAGGKFTVADIADIRKNQRNKCAEPTCRKRLTRATEHIDHIIPVARGGTSWRKNLQLLCQQCNQSKGSYDPITYAQRQGRLL